ncbi:c-type cytochrome biogenesis protein CcmI [Alteromonadaceae bacterium M269]|nr:c-type cytochrome biogenesis protein CcmI [Alteromonadaceae bacterium M269]
MIFFILIAIGLVLFASLLILIPAMRSRGANIQEQESRRELNVRLTKQRLNELDDELAQGLLTDEAYQAAQEELKVGLVTEIDKTNDEHTSGSIKWAVAVGFIASVIACGIVYQRVSQLPRVNHWQETVSNAEGLKNKLGQASVDNIGVSDLRDVALVLRTALIDSPEDHRRWHMLGRVYMSLQRPDLAAEALEKSLAIDQNVVEAMMTYSQALITLGDEFSLNKAKNWLSKAVESRPQSQQAWGLLAVTATQLGDNQLAQRCWQTLATIIEPSDPAYALVQQQLNSHSDNESEARTTFDIQVELSSELADKLPEKAFLFVFAQDNKSDVRMPAAVVKIPLSKFPLQVELSSQDAMMPSYNLNQLEQVKLVARISVDENVATSFGELQGETVVDVIHGNRSSQTIIINQELL